LADNPVPHTVFSVRYKTGKAIDLTEPPLKADEKLWKHPSDYTACQQLADEARKANIQLIRSDSVRCPKKGKNISILSCAAFESNSPEQTQTWHIAVHREEVITVRDFPREKLTFPISDLLPGIKLRNPTKRASR